MGTTRCLVALLVGRFGRGILRRTNVANRPRHHPFLGRYGNHQQQMVQSSASPVRAWNLGSRGHYRLLSAIGDEHGMARHPLQQVLAVMSYSPRIASRNLTDEAVRTGGDLMKAGRAG